MKTCSSTISSEHTWTPTSAFRSCKISPSKSSLDRSTAFCKMRYRCSANVEILGLLKLTFPTEAKQASVLLCLHFQKTQRVMTLPLQKNLYLGRLCINIDFLKIQETTYISALLPSTSHKHRFNRVWFRYHGPLHIFFIICGSSLSFSYQYKNYGSLNHPSY